jgi:hypothetical protein
MVGSLKRFMGIRGIPCKDKHHRSTWVSDPFNFLFPLSGLFALWLGEYTKNLDVYLYCHLYWHGVAYLSVNKVLELQ